MLYKVGDKVKIKKREELEQVFIVADEMLKYAGAITTITNYPYEGHYSLEIDGGQFGWDDECFEKEGWKAAPSKNYVDEKFEERVVGIGPHGEEFTSTKATCNYIPASHIKTEPMFDILYERINKLEKRIEELERKVDLVLETLKELINKEKQHVDTESK